MPLSDLSLGVEEVLYLIVIVQFWPSAIITNEAIVRHFGFLSERFDGHHRTRSVLAPDSCNNPGAVVGRCNDCTDLSLLWVNVSDAVPLSLTHCMHTTALGVASISFEDEGSFLYRRSNKLPEIMARLLIKSTDRSQECNYYRPPTHQFVIICTHKLKNRCCNLSRYRRIGLQEEVPISHAMNAFR